MSRKPRPAPAPDPAAGERIAKVLSRAGVASRREAERMIAAGEVTVNGRVIDSPALNVTPADRIAVRGEPLAPPEPARLWLYHKPEGLVTSAADEKGRATIFDALPPDMPRVMSVGRLDLNSEGLLLLTNDGALKRRLELPSTGWLRKYRVRVKGNPTDPDLEPLRQGITVDGERFQPMTVVLDRHQGANAWLTVGLREGRNREVRRAMTAIGLTVNRLIRIAYGPFRLGELAPGAVEEVRPRILRDQLGLEEPLEAAKAPAAAPKAPARGPAARPAKPGAPAPRPASGAGGRRRAAPAEMDAQDPARSDRRRPAAKPGPKPARSFGGRAPADPDRPGAEGARTAAAKGRRTTAAPDTAAPAGGRSFRAKAPARTPGDGPAPRRGGPSDAKPSGPRPPAGRGAAPRKPRG